MKFSLNKLVVAAALVAPALAMASVGGSGMLGGRHDFATRAMFLTYQTAAAGTQGAANQVGLCSFCHTPHNAVSTSLLWNRAPATQNYTWDEATTTGGTAYASITPAYKGSTVKCLSCHDGAVSIGDVAVYKESSRTGAGTLNTYKVGDLDAAPKVSKKVGAGGAMAGTHPVGMPYPFGQATSTYNSIATGSAVVLTEFVAAPTVSTSTVSGVKLYKDTGSAIVAGTAAGATGMECNSCHDVHNKSSTEDVMLRGKLVGSTQADGYICLQCHIK